MKKLAIAPIQDRLYVSNAGDHEPKIIVIGSSRVQQRPWDAETEANLLRLKSIAAKPPFCIIHKVKKYDPL